MLELFKFRVVFPPRVIGNPNTWKHNARYNVLAPSIETAIKSLKQSYPDVVILTITSLGKADMVELVNL